MYPIKREIRVSNWLVIVDHHYKQNWRSDCCSEENECSNCDNPGDESLVVF